MKEKIVNQKDINWIVAENGDIFSPEKKTFVCRTRNNKSTNYEKIIKKTKLSVYINKAGYKEVCQQVNGKRMKMFVHRLVALAFVDGYKENLTVNHINGNKLDNRIENLEWVSLADNTKHQWQTGLVNLRGENQPTHKLTQKQVIHIRKALQLGVPSNSLSIIANVNPSTIHLIKQNKRWADIF